MLAPLLNAGPADGKTVTGYVTAAHKVELAWTILPAAILLSGCLYYLFRHIF